MPTINTVYIRWVHSGCQRFPHGNTLPDTASHVPRRPLATLCHPGYHGSLGVPGHSIASAMINYCPNEMWGPSKCQSDDMRLSMWASKDCYMTEPQRQIQISCHLFFVRYFICLHLGGKQQPLRFYCKLGGYLYLECKQAEICNFFHTEYVISPLIFYNKHWRISEMITHLLISSLLSFHHKKAC